VLRVVDRGSGIAASDLELVFEPFYRGADGGPHAGSGLGLAIARGLVEVNGGRLWAEPTPGRGVTFSIELPREPIADVDRGVLDRAR
jgi:two-component system, OmpR family, sensor histidine kinase KdpD